MSSLPPKVSPLCMENAKCVLVASSRTHTHTCTLLVYYQQGKALIHHRSLETAWGINAKLCCDLALQFCVHDTLGKLFNANKRGDREHSVTLDVTYFSGDSSLSAFNILITHLSYMLEEFTCSSVPSISSHINEFI